MSYLIDSGRIFFNKYKQEKAYDKNVKTFFCDILAPIVYDGDRHMHNVSNNPFFYIARKFKNSTKEECDELNKEALNKLVKKIEDGIRDATTLVECYSLDMSQPTSSFKGDYAYTEEDCYYSYIGAMLSVMCGKDMVTFFDADILYYIFNGISVYHDILKCNINIKDKQINTFNGLYLLAIDDNLNDVLEDYKQHEKQIESFKTAQFLDILLSACDKFNIEYVYISSIGQTNKCYGLFPVDIEGVNSYKKIITEVIKNETLLKEYRNSKNLARAIINTNMLPKSSIFESQIIDKNIYQLGDFKAKTITDDSKKSKFYLQLLKIKLEIYMNNDTILQQAKNLVSILIEAKQTKTKTTERNNIVEYIVNSLKNREDLFEKLTKLVNYIDNPETIFNFMTNTEQYLKDRNNFTIFKAYISVIYAMETKNK